MAKIVVSKRRIAACRNGIAGAAASAIAGAGLRRKARRASSRLHAGDILAISPAAMRREAVAVA
jgi:hypothetical protein